MSPIYNERDPRTLATQILMTLAFLLIGTDHLTQAWGTPALDADPSWGRGPHMTLVNPALIGDLPDQINLSY